VSHIMQQLQKKQTSNWKTKQKIIGFLNGKYNQKP
jgi:hypothetical protein